MAKKVRTVREYIWPVTIPMPSDDGMPNLWVSKNEAERQLNLKEDESERLRMYVDGADGAIARRDVEIEQRDAMLAMAMPALRFVNHIQEHINKGEPTPDIRGQEVVCKICGKTIGEINKERKS